MAKECTKYFTFLKPIPSKADEKIHKFKQSDGFEWQLLGSGNEICILK